MRRRRGAFQPSQLIGLVVLWVLLWGELSFAVVASGIVVALVVTRVFPMPRLRDGFRLRPWALVTLLASVARDLVTASTQVAWQALRFGRVPPTTVVAVELRARSDLTLTFTAVVVSIVPGTVVVEVRHATRTLYLHVLGGGDEERTRRAVLRDEARVVRAIGTRDDVRRVAGGPSTVDAETEVTG